jgi:hypothetical protein
LRLGTAGNGAEHREESQAKRGRHGALW